MKKNEKTVAEALCADKMSVMILDVIISVLLVVLLGQVMAMDMPSDQKAIGAALLCFMPLIGVVIFGVKKNWLLLTMLTAMSIFVMWLTMCCFTAAFKDESYAAAIAVTAIVAMIGFVINKKAELDSYEGAMVVIAVAIIVIISYIWAGALYTPVDRYESTEWPEMITSYKTDFVFGWGWAMVMAVVAAGIAALPLFWKKK